MTSSDSDYNTDEVVVSVIHHKFTEEPELFESLVAMATSPDHSARVHRVTLQLLRTLMVQTSFTYPNGCEDFLEEMLQVAGSCLLLRMPEGYVQSIPSYVLTVSKQRTTGEGQSVHLQLGQ